MIKAGYLPGSPAKVVLVIVAVLIQGLLPFFGHAAIVKTLRLLVVPFVVLFAVLLGFAIPHANLHVVKTSGDWQGFMEALAFTIALSGLGWTENGNDYTRYCPSDTSKKGIVGWVFLGTAVPQILIMTLGAVRRHLRPQDRDRVRAGSSPSPTRAPSRSWFVVVFLLFAVVQLFGINSLDMYSSGVTLQAVGVPVKRYQAVLIDCAIALAVTMWAIFSSSFTQYLEDFVDIVIVWIAPWCAIFLVDWVLRRYRYVPSELQKTGRDSLYWRKGGINWAALVAQVLGMFAAISGLAATFHLPDWLNLVTVHTRDAFGFGGDVSIFFGMGAAALVYVVLAWSRCAGRRTRRSRCSGRRGCSRPEPAGTGSSWADRLPIRAISLAIIRVCPRSWCPCPTTSSGTSTRRHADGPRAEARCWLPRRGGNSPDGTPKPLQRPLPGPSADSAPREPSTPPSWSDAIEIAGHDDASGRHLGPGQVVSQRGRARGRRDPRAPRRSATR